MKTKDIDIAQNPITDRTLKDSARKSALSLLEYLCHPEIDREIVAAGLLSISAWAAPRRVHAAIVEAYGKREPEVSP